MAAVREASTATVASAATLILVVAGPGAASAAGSMATAAVASAATLKVAASESTDTGLLIRGAAVDMVGPGIACVVGTTPFVAAIVMAASIGALVVEDAV